MKWNVYELTRRLIESCSRASSRCNIYAQRLFALLAFNFASTRLSALFSTHLSHLHLKYCDRYRCVASFPAPSTLPTFFTSSHSFYLSRLPFISFLLFDFHQSTGCNHSLFGVSYTILSCRRSKQKLTTFMAGMLSNAVLVVLSLMFDVLLI